LGDYHHLGGRRPEDYSKHTTSIHQTALTDQITELLTDDAPIVEVESDIRTLTEFRGPYHESSEAASPCSFSHYNRT